MSNPILLTGKVVDKAGDPVAFARVEAWDKDRSTSDDFLGSSFTTENGSFSIQPTGSREFLMDRYPDVYYKVIIGNEMMLSTEDDVMNNVKESPEPITLTLDVDLPDPNAPKEAVTSGASVYFVQNQWGGERAPWHEGGAWVMGIRGSKGQYIVALDFQSGDEGKSFFGTITYAGEGPIGFRATEVIGNTYFVDNQWGGNDDPWHPAGYWVYGGADHKSIKVGETCE